MPTLITTQGTKMLLMAQFGGEIGLIWGELRSSGYVRRGSQRRFVGQVRSSVSTLRAIGSQAINFFGLRRL